MNMNNETAVELKPERKYYNGVSLFKYICMFFIVAVHTEPFKDFGIRINDIFFHDMFYNWCSRAALSFYFLTSGFLLSRNIKYSLSIGGGRVRPFLRYILQALRLYGIWILVYLPFQLVNDISMVSDLKGYLTLFVDQVLIRGTYEHLWFMPALIISLIITWLLGCRTRGIAPFVLAIFVYLFFLLGQSYQAFGMSIAQTSPSLAFFDVRTLVGEDFGLLRRIFGSGFPFVAIGYFMGTFELDRLKEYVNLKIVAVAVTIVYFLEFVLLKQPNPIITLALPVMTAMLLIIATNLPFKKLSNERARMFAVLSSGVYMSHMVLMLYLKSVMSSFGIFMERGGQNATLFYLLTMGISTLFCLIIYRSSKKGTVLKLLS